MFSLSTCWFGGRNSSGKDVIKDALEMGFSGVEIGYGLGEDALNDIVGMVKDGGVRVSSLHAFTPAKEGGGGHPELFSIANVDDNERIKAVGKVFDNLMTAESVGARAVVVHAGRITEAARNWLYIHNRIMNDKASGFFYKYKLKKLYDVRAAHSVRAIDALSRSLDELLPGFEKAGISLALENLPSYDALPSVEEMDLLAARFSSSPAFGFWFDIGHAQVMENAGFGDGVTVAKRFAPLIKGLHIHDVIGPGGDHQAPGLGGIDFKSFSFLKDKILVFEPSSMVQRDDLVASVAFMKKVWRLE